VSQDYPICVVADGKLIGFFSMPSTPFVWLGFRNNQVDKPILDFDGSTGYYGAGYKYLFHRIVVPPVQKFETVEDINLQTVVSGELVELFDKYGIVLPVQLSERLEFETGQVSQMGNSLRKFCLLNFGQVEFVWKGFVRLLENWVDMYGRCTLVKPDLAEVLLMRVLMLQFTQEMPERLLGDLGLSRLQRLMLKHMFTPPEIRAVIPQKELAIRETLMKTQGGYHYFW
jgi:hypothetical protein